MFDVANDRLSYGELLRPDVGYTLDFAVGTTYSLDLEALLGVPVSLGLLGDADAEQMRSPLYVLEAIRTSSDKIAIFCNAGGIKLPDKIQSVYSLLEESVFQVKLSRNSNFHPKLWVLKYSNEAGKSYIKLLVLSRNLTFDSSIDLCVAMRGEVKHARRLKNKSLADILTFVGQYAKRAKQQQILSLAEDVMRVPTFEVEHPFEDYTFFPMGIPDYPGSDTKLFEQKYDLFAVSPFLSDNVVQQLTENAGQKILVTRKSSVTKRTMEAFDHVFITKDILSDNEFGSKQDIHAKLYFTTTQDGNYLYIGSANASHNAFYRNVECLLRLKYKLNCIGMKTFTQDFLPSENCPYEELTYIPEIPPADPSQKLIDEALREAVYALKRADVLSNGTAYSIQINAKELKTAEPVLIAPLQRQNLMTTLRPETVFDGLLLKEISEFFILRVQSQTLVVKVDTQGIPKDRDQAIYRGIIDSKAKFMTYLSFVLSESPASFTAETDLLDDVLLCGNGRDGAGAATAAIYEKMLRVFHQNPNRLKGIADMIRRLEPDVVGEDFVQMYQQFEAAAKKVRK